MFRRATALIALLMCMPVLGCAPALPTAGSASDPALPSVASDYPGWTVESRRFGPTSTRIVAGPDAGVDRHDVAFEIVDRDSGIQLLAWYARSSSDSTSTGWVNPDELYRSNPSSERATSLYLWMHKNKPSEWLLGAYREEDGGGVQSPEPWHVGFYSESGDSWVRGDHLMTYDASTDTWALVEEDSGSDNPWNIAGAVRFTR